MSKPSKALSAAVNAMPPEFLLCREGNHALKPRTANLDRRRKTCYRTRQCVNCLSIRHEWIDMRDWSLIKYRYEYSEGYLLKGFGRQDKGIFREQATLAGGYTLTSDEP